MVKENYLEIIKTSRPESLLDVLHVLQNVDGYVTSEAMEVLAGEFGCTPGRIYESASFYSLVRFTPPPEVTIQVCRSAPCHVAGMDKVIQALEDTLGIGMGETTPDNRYKLEYVECLGQCQDSPSLLVNKILYKQMNAEKVRDLVGKGGLSKCIRK